MFDSNGHSSANLVDRIRDTHLEIWLYSQVLGKKLAQVRELSALLGEPTGRAVQQSAPMLSNRLIEVVRLVSLGCSNIQIGSILDLSESTIDNYRTRAMKIMDAHCSASLTRLAIKFGFTTLHDELTSQELAAIANAKQRPCHKSAKQCG